MSAAAERPRRWRLPPADHELVVRPVDDTRDPPGLVALVGLCFAEYPGCVLHVNEEEPGLLAPGRCFDACWIVAWRDRVLGSIAASDHPVDGRPGCELKKCYLHPWLRGRGLATRLVRLVEDHARARGHAAVELWSDTRFTTAHAVYEHLGYRPTGRERSLQDRSATREFHFLKELRATAKRP